VKVPLPITRCIRTIPSSDFLDPKANHVTTTVTSVSDLSAGLATALGGVAVLALILFLVQRELAGSAGPRFRPLTRVLIIVIAPLLVVFLAIVISRLAALI
jgi:hypothetical protein